MAGRLVVSQRFEVRVRRRIMQIRERVANRGKFAANLLWHRATNRRARFSENSYHDAGEKQLPYDRGQSIYRPDRFRISIREAMHFRLMNLDLIFASNVRGRRNTSPDQHAFSTGK